MLGGEAGGRSPKLHLGQPLEEPDRYRKQIAKFRGTASAIARKSLAFTNFRHRGTRNAMMHLELPEDIAGEEVPEIPLVKLHPIDIQLSFAALDRAAELILKAKRRLVMLGAAAKRPRLAGPLSHFVRRVRISDFNTQMGKGFVTGGSGLYMGTAALSERDYVHRAIDRPI